MMWGDIGCRKRNFATDNRPLYSWNAIRVKSCWYWSVIIFYPIISLSILEVLANEESGIAQLFPFVCLNHLRSKRHSTIYDQAAVPELFHEFIHSVAMLILLLRLVKGQHSDSAILVRYWKNKFTVLSNPSLFESSSTMKS